MAPKNDSATAELDASSEIIDVSEQYNKLQQSWLQACVAIGALAASIPYTYMFQRYTKKWVFLSAGIISACKFILLSNEVLLLIDTSCDSQVFEKKNLIIHYCNGN
ncbi:unnamed protein product [Strongylus vulgaris]|uniref:Uncharacterized protein n=1 Tax=Strongylus vulgaris TaxID=40348 RepID=A0A3P7KW33_STRVU|nr:unnamed protein product [Strongylus vulgaris]